MSSKFGEIRQNTTELAALERLKKSHRLIMEKMTSSHFSATISKQSIIITFSNIKAKVATFDIAV